MKCESSRLYAVKKGNRSAVVKKGTYFTTGKYIVDFYYEGMPDYEWKRGAHGIPCDICDTLTQAKRKADYYINKAQ